MSTGNGKSIHITDMPRTVDLGAGQHPAEPNALTVDLARNDPDVVHDLEETPYPLPDSYFEAVHMSHVLEHLENWESAVREVYRILQPGGLWHVTVPYPSVTQAHIDHERRINPHFPYNVLQQKTPTSVEGVYFDVEEFTLRWRAKSHYTGEQGTRVFEARVFDLIGKVLNPLANTVLQPFFIRFNLFGRCEELQWTLRKVEVEGR